MLKTSENFRQHHMRMFKYVTYGVISKLQLETQHALCSYYKKGTYNDEILATYMGYMKNILKPLFLIDFRGGAL